MAVIHGPGGVLLDVVIGLGGVFLRPRTEHVLSDVCDRNGTARGIRLAAFNEHNQQVDFPEITMVWAALDDGYLPAGDLPAPISEFRTPDRGRKFKVRVGSSIRILVRNNSHVPVTVVGFVVLHDEDPP